MNNSPLGPDSTLRELFDEIEVAEGVNVVPVSLTNADDKIARMMVCVCGNSKEANLVLANLMAYVDQMHAAAEQARANAEAEDEQRTIVVP